MLQQMKGRDLRRLAAGAKAPTSAHNALKPKDGPDRPASKRLNFTRSDHFSLIFHYTSQIKRTFFGPQQSSARGLRGDSELEIKIRAVQ